MASSSSADEPTAAAARHALARFGLFGKTAIVTGGTKGIGRACVEELSALGARVFTCSRNAEDLAAALAEWGEAARQQRADDGGFVVAGVAADVSTPEGRELLVSSFSKTFFPDEGGEAPRCDILVNNVGTNVKKPSVEYTKGDYDVVFGTNLESAVALTAMLHPLLKRGAAAAARREESVPPTDTLFPPPPFGPAPPTSSVVLMSSVAGGPPSMKSGSLYAATKAALDQLARNWACEWARDGIRVTAVKPFYIDTPLAAGVVRGGGGGGGAGGDDDGAGERRLRQVLDATPSRRVGSPEDVAGVVAFLCSRAAAHVTGETVSVDGGYLAAGFWPPDC